MDNTTPVTKEEVAIMLGIPESTIRSFGPYAPEHPKYPGATVTYVENRSWKKHRYSRGDTEGTIEDKKLEITAKQATSLRDKIASLEQELKMKESLLPAPEAEVEAPVDEFARGSDDGEDLFPEEVKPKKEKKKKKQKA